MLIKDFADRYCQDMLSSAKESKGMLELADFSYDEIIEEFDGTKIKVINALDYQIPLMDILSMTRTEFARVWPYQECLEAYDKYIESIVFLDGKEAVCHIRNTLQREMDKIELFSKSAGNPNARV